MLSDVTGLRRFALMLILCSFAGAARAASFVTFEAPGCLDATFVRAINSADVVTGNCRQLNDDSFGFVRAADGTFTTFQVGRHDLTVPLDIDEKGNVIGTAGDGRAVHGFIRTPAGDITIFDVPAAAGVTDAEVINEHGAIAGSFIDSQSNIRGFLRNRRGKFTTFEAPGNPLTTQVTSMNDKGEIAGLSFDANHVYHGFIRGADGTMSTLDLPGFQATMITDINNDGVITGICDTSAEATSPIGFVRQSDGTIDTFTGRHGGKNIFQTAIDRFGEITASYIDPKAGERGLLRETSGKIAVFDVEGANTYSTAINNKGDTAGYFTNSSDGRTDGFIRLH